MEKKKGKIKGGKKKKKNIDGCIFSSGW
jgi:hypothetical protein